jgi:protein-tyrosine phosphatase
MGQLRWNNCHNVRDLGGYSTANGGKIRWQALIRADNLHSLTGDGCFAVLDYGVRSIIDLRFRSEVFRKPNPLASHAGIHYLHLPIFDDQNMTAKAAIQSTTNFTTIYCRMLDWGHGHIANIINAVATAPPGAILVHCHAGKDRTGLIVALILSLLGVSYSDIAFDFSLSATCLMPLYHEHLLNTDDPIRRADLMRQFEAEPHTILDTLAYLDSRYYGARAYFKAAGIPDATLDALVQRLTGE